MDNSEIEAFDRVLGEESEQEYECFNCRTTKAPTLTFASRVGPPIFGLMTFVAPYASSLFSGDIIEDLCWGVFFFVLWSRSLMKLERGCPECGSVFVPGARKEGFPGTDSSPSNGHRTGSFFS